MTIPKIRAWLAEDKQLLPVEIITFHNQELVGGK